MGSKRLKIRIGPRRLEAVLVVNGRGVDLANVGLDQGMLDAAWKDGLRPLDGAFHALMKQLKVRERLPADVLYESDETASEVISVAASGRAAHDAALLAMADRVSFPLHTNPVSTRVLGVDRGGEQPKTHVLVTADREESANAVVMWIERNGAQAGRIMPTPVPPIVSLVRRVLDGTSDARVCAYVGCQNTVFAGSSRGSLAFVRTIDIGYDLLIEVFERGLGGVAAEQSAATRESALEHLFKVGVPGRDQVIDSLTGAKGSSILPLMHPALQRMAVEFKHTVRFGLDERSRNGLDVELLGPGAAVPSLDEALTVMTEFPVTRGADDPSQDRVGAKALPSELVTDIAIGDVGAGLLPARLQRRELKRRVSAPLRIGAIAGLAILVGEGVLAYRAQVTLDRTLDANVAALAEVRAEDEAWARGVTASKGLAKVRRELVDLNGVRPDWGGVLTELAGFGQGEVHLLEIAADSSGEKMTMSLRGFVHAGDRSTETLGSYIERLRQSPLFESIELGSTRASEVNGVAATQFSLMVELSGRPLRRASVEANQW